MDDAAAVVHVVMLAANIITVIIMADIIREFMERPIVRLRWMMIVMVQQLLVMRLLLLAAAVALILLLLLLLLVIMMMIASRTVMVVGAVPVMGGRCNCRESTLWTATATATASAEIGWCP